MVHCHETAFFLAPFEHREVYHPQQRELVLVAQAQTVTHLQTQFAQLLAGLHGIVATHNQNQVARLSLHSLFQVLKYFLRVELVYAALYAAVFLYAGIYQTFGTDLAAFYEVGQLIQLLAGV